MPRDDDVRRPSLCHILLTAVMSVLHVPHTAASLAGPDDSIIAASPWHVQDRHHRSSRSSKHGRDRDRSRSRDRDRDHHKSSKSSHRDRTPPKRIPVRQRRPTGFDVLPHQVGDRGEVQGSYRAPVNDRLSSRPSHCDT